MSTTTLKGAHLSLQQDRLQFFQQGSRTYRSQCTVFMKGMLNRRVFQQALQQLVEQHTIFQTVFYSPAGMDVPIQVMGHQVAFSFPMINLEEIDGSRQHIVLHTLLTSLQEQAFDLKHGPLFCPVTFHLSAETTLLLISLPALCADVFTLPLLVADLVKRYRASLSGQECTEEPLQYTAVSAWQKQVLLEESEGAQTAHEFWKKWDVSRVTQVQQLLEQAGLVKHGSLQATHKTIFEPLTLPLEVEEAVSRRIRALASDCHVSVTAILLACWFIVLWRLTDESQFVIGVACDGRNYEELAEAMGLYTRFVPLSAYLEDDWTFEQVVTFIEPLLEAARKYQSYFSWPGVPNATTASPSPSFFPVTFEHERWPASFPAEELTLSLDQRWCCTEPFILKLGILQVGERLQVELHYDPQSVMTERVTRLASMLQVLLQSVVEQPQAPVGTLTLLTADEQSHLLTTFRAP
ncbi:MAG TPA: condensation domain-containing protein, partial [Ktedonobacteraceae bacterium]|nr:condensation domain-containing protein [Ktedonobacteraceae bacterium]